MAAEEFAETVFTDEAGIEHHWNLAQTLVQLSVNNAKPVPTRQITRLDTKKVGKPRQAHILTSRTDLTAAQVAHRMDSRWRQENYFRYGRMHLDLDSHDTYSAAADDPRRMVPNPAKREAHQKVKTATATVEREESAANASLLAARAPAPGQTEVLISSCMHNEITDKWRAAAEQLNIAASEHALTPARVALAGVPQLMDIRIRPLGHGGGDVEPLKER